MKIDAPKQNIVLELLLQTRQAMSLRTITNNCSLTYHQVTSSLLALMSKGYVKRVQTGVYQVTEDAILIMLSPDVQIKILQNKVNELELLVKSLLTRMSRI